MPNFDKTELPVDEIIAKNTSGISGKLSKGTAKAAKYLRFGKKSNTSTLKTETTFSSITSSDSSMSVAPYHNNPTGRRGPDAQSAPVMNPGTNRKRKSGIPIPSRSQSQQQVSRDIGSQQHFHGDGNIRANSIPGHPMPQKQRPIPRPPAPVLDQQSVNSTPDRSTTVVDRSVLANDILNRALATLQDDFLDEAAQIHDEPEPISKPPSRSATNTVPENASARKKSGHSYSEMKASKFAGQFNGSLGEKEGTGPAAQHEYKKCSAEDDSIQVNGDINNADYLERVLNARFAIRTNSQPTAMAQA